jgi:hypothetical protein
MAVVLSDEKGNQTRRIEMPDENKREEGGISRREFIKDAGLMVGSAAIGSAASLAAAPAQIASAQAAAPVTLEVLDAGGAYEVTQLFASRLPDLNGKIVCEVTDGIWQAWRTFPLIRELLKKQFPTIKIIPFDQFPQASSSVPTDLVAKVKAAGCQAAIVGNAG